MRLRLNASVKLASINVLWPILLVGHLASLTLATPLHGLAEEPPLGPALGYRPNQKVFPFNEQDSPISILAADKPVSEGNLSRLVSDTYMKNLPSSIKSTRSLSGLSSKVVKAWKNLGDDADYTWLDVVFPLSDTCRPLISRKIPLAEGLYCTQSSCSQQVQVTTTQTYESQFGLSMSATFGFETDAIFVKESFAVTVGASYSFTWGTQNSFQKTYTFNLGQGEFCTPSMIHLELECDVTGNSVHFDTVFDNKDNITYPLQPGQTNGRPVNDGAQCGDLTLDDIYNEDNDWIPVKSDNPKLGSYWRGRTSELTGHAGRWAPTLDDSKLVIRNHPDVFTPYDGGPATICTRVPGATKAKTVRIPVADNGNALMGFIGCVN